MVALLIIILYITIPADRGYPDEVQKTDQERFGESRQER